jgi:hypothetical protein
LKLKIKAEEEEMEIKIFKKEEELEALWLLQRLRITVDEEAEKIRKKKLAEFKF